MSSEQASIILATGNRDTEGNALEQKFPGPIPDYLKDIYTWAYLTPTSISIFDRHWIVSLILLGNYVKLERAMLEELRPGAQVLQAACVYGRYSRVLADYLGQHGHLDVIDIAPIQAENCELKLLNYHNTSVRVADAALPDNEKYDAVSCFFLLHEVPDNKKIEITDNLLNKLGPGGKLVFVDYHRPHWLHPFKALISFVFTTLEPFARSLWEKEISDYATRAHEFSWEKKTYFGGMYQKVVVTRKKLNTTSDTF